MKRGSEVSTTMSWRSGLTGVELEESGFEGHVNARSIIKGTTRLDFTPREWEELILLLDVAALL